MTLVMMLGLVGCANTKESSSKKEDFSDVTLKVWGGDLLTNEAFREYFEANAGGMKYEVVEADEIKLMSMIASGTAPDVWILSAFGFGAPYAARGLYEPLDEYIEDSEVFNADNFADVMDMYRFDGKQVGSGPLYGIIKDWSIDNQIWINKAVFEDAGLEIPDPEKTYTWDDIRDWAKACVEYDKDGNQTRWGFGTSNSLYQLIAGMVGSTGNSMFTDDLTGVNIDSPEIRAAFEYWADMYKSGAAIGAISSPGDWGGDSFAADRLGILCAGYWAGNGYYAFMEGLDLDNFVMIQAPSLDASKPGNACLAGVGGSIWVGSEHKDAAFKFLELYLGGDYAKEMAILGYGNPASTDLVELLPQETEFQKQTYDSNKLAMENMITLKTNPFITNASMEATFTKYFNEVLFDRMTMDDAITGMQSEFEIFLEEGREICGVE